MISSIALILFLVFWIATIAMCFLWRQSILGIILTILLAMLGIGEIVSKMKYGLTITNRFKAWMKTHRLYGWIVLGCMWLAMTMLCVHLYPWPK